MTAGTFPDCWSETALVTLTKEGTSEAIQFATVTESVDISQGDKGIETIKNIHGGRLIKLNPEEETEVTLELYPVSMITTTGDGGFFQRFFGSPAAGVGTTSPWNALNYDDASSGKPNIRNRYRIAILWTDDDAATNAAGSTATAHTALRFVARNCYITSHKLDFTDDILKATVTFTVPAANKAAYSNAAWQSSTGALAAISTTYTYSATGTDWLSATA